MGRQGGWFWKRLVYIWKTWKRGIGRRKKREEEKLFVYDEKVFLFFRLFNSRILRAAKKTSFSDACVRLLRWFQWVVVGNCGRSGEKVWNEGGMQDRVRVRVWDWDWRLEIGLQMLMNADVRGGYKRGCWVYVYKDLL